MLKYQECSYILDNSKCTLCGDTLSYTRNTFAIIKNEDVYISIYFRDIYDVFPKKNP